MRFIIDILLKVMVCLFAVTGFSMGESGNLIGSLAFYFLACIFIDVFAYVKCTEE